MGQATSMRSDYLLSNLADRASLCYTGRLSVVREVALGILTSFCAQDWPAGKPMERNMVSMSDFISTNSYEIVYILRPDLEEGEAEAATQRFAQVVESQGGEIVLTDPWGTRKLAYSIKDYTEGVYILHHFDMPPVGMDPLERMLRLNESVLRYMILRND